MVDVTAVAIVTSSMLGGVIGNLMMGMSKRVRVRLSRMKKPSGGWRE